MVSLGRYVSARSLVYESAPSLWVTALACPSIALLCPLQSMCTRCDLEQTLCQCGNKQTDYFKNELKQLQQNKHILFLSFGLSSVPLSNNSAVRTDPQLSLNLGGRESWSRRLGYGPNRAENSRVRREHGSQHPAWIIKIFCFLFLVPFWNKWNRQLRFEQNYHNWDLNWLF